MRLSFHLAFGKRALHSLPSRGNAAWLVWPETWPDGRTDFAPTPPFAPRGAGRKLWSAEGRLFRWYDEGGLFCYRVYRGGSWYDVAGLFRSARNTPAGRGHFLGFRVALVLQSDGEDVGCIQVALSKNGPVESEMIAYVDWRDAMDVTHEHRDITDP